jgi:hypothetical protein
MSNFVDTLEPNTRAMCKAHLLACAEFDIFLRVTQATRSHDEQLHLWMKGRELHNGVWVIVDESQVVTKAPPGESAHNFAMAYDVCFEGADPYLDAYRREHKKYDPRWQKIGELGESRGLKWGGPLGDNDKLTWDRPHFERANWREYRSPVV